MDLSDPKFQLNRASPIPLYFQVKRIILNELALGNLNCGDTLPSEMEFCESLGVSRPTVRQALSELEAEGVVTRKKRSGTVIAERKTVLDAGFYPEGLSGLLREAGYTPHITISDFCVIDPAGEINKKLDLSPSERLLYLKRFWMNGTTPLIYTVLYGSHRKLEPLMDRDFTKDSMDTCLRELGFFPSRVVSEMEATIASRMDLDQLAVKQAKAALMCVKTVLYDKTGQPLTYTVTRCRSDRFVFTAGRMLSASF